MKRGTGGTYIDGLGTRCAPPASFSEKLKPISDSFEPDAMRVHGLTLEMLGRADFEPELAMKKFAE